MVRAVIADVGPDAGPSAPGSLAQVAPPDGVRSPVVMAVGVALSVVLLYYLLVYRWRVHVELGVYRERLGVSRPVGWAMFLVPPAGIALTHVLGTPEFGEGVSTYDVALPVFVVGTFLAGWGLGRLPDYLDLRRSGRSPTGSVESGRVAVEGTAVAAGERLRTPVGDEPCLCYRLRVRDERGLLGRNWVTVEVREGTTRFEVDDGSGPVAVDPAGAHLDLGPPTDESPATLGYETVQVDGDAPAYVLDLVDRNPGVDLGDRLQYREELVAPGDDVFVVGTATGDGEVTIGTGDGSYFLVSGRPGEAVRQRLRRIVTIGGTLGAVGAAGAYVVMLASAGGI